MSVKIRLQRHGSKKRPFYFIVVATSTSPRDGKFIEKLGTYNPLTIPASVRIERDRALYWLNEGAQPTDTCRRILSFKGVMFKKHLMRGVTLGLFDEAAAEEKFEKWNSDHETLVANRDEAHRIHKAEKRNAVTSDSVKLVTDKNTAKAEANKAALEEAAAAESASNTENVPTEEVANADEAAPTEEVVAEAEAPAKEEAPAQEAEAPATEEKPEA